MNCLLLLAALFRVKSCFKPIWMGTDSTDSGRFLLIFCLRLPDLDALRDHLALEGRLAPQDAIDLVRCAGEILRQEPNLLRLNDPITGTITSMFNLGISVCPICLSPPVSPCFTPLSVRRRPRAVL